MAARGCDIELEAVPASREGGLDALASALGILAEQPATLLVVSLASFARHIKKKSGQIF